MKKNNANNANAILVYILQRAILKEIEIKEPRR